MLYWLPKLILGVLAMALFYAGFVYLFHHDQVWGGLEQRRRKRGVAPAERTPAWEHNVSISGLVAAGCGILVIVIILILP